MPADIDRVREDKRDDLLHVPRGPYGEDQPDRQVAEQARNVIQNNRGLALFTLAEKVMRPLPAFAKLNVGRGDRALHMFPERTTFRGV